MHFTISENSLIGRIGSDADLEVNEVTFESLKVFANQLDATQILQYFVRKGQEYIGIKNYVGLLSLHNKTQIEILPKISQDSVSARKVLTQMLRCVSYLPFKKLPSTALQNSDLPLWEVFIGLFLEEVKTITQKGLQRNYEPETSESNFIKGKWLMSSQFNKPRISQTQFLVESDDFSLNILPNRILKTCLYFLKDVSSSVENSRKISQLIPLFEDVVLLKKGQKIVYKSTNQKFEYYQSAVEWAKIILNQQSWLGQAGQSMNSSLLFPSEQLFENYISQGFRKYFVDYEVFIQKSEQFLIDNHNGQKQFQLRPDVMIKKENNCIIFDAKWKLIDVSASNYGIDQRDLYQLYAYGKKHEAHHLFLIYPAHSAFNSPPQPFDFDETYRLQVWPFDVSKPLSEEMTKLKYFIERSGIQNKRFVEAIE